MSQMPSSGSGAASPSALSPPFGSRQNVPVVRGKNGALAASLIVPPPPEHAAGLAAAGGGGGAPRGSSALQPASTHVENVASASAGSIATRPFRRGDRDGRA